MAAITIITILAGLAFFDYRELMPSARVDRVQHDLRTLADAISTYNRDHAHVPYSSYSLEDLKGRYLDDVPLDPWGMDFIVDPYLQRIVSRGPDKVLQTIVPGHEECPNRATDGDDFARAYGEVGSISFIGDGTLQRMPPDGLAIEPIGPLANTEWASQSPDRNRFLVSSAGKLTILERSSDAWVTRTIQFPAAVTGGTDCSWSPDGLAIAFVAAPSLAVAVGEMKEEYRCNVCSESKRPALKCDKCGGDLDKTVSCEPVLVTTPAGGAVNPCLAPGNREVIFGDTAGNVYRASAAELSPSSIVNCTMKLDSGTMKCMPDLDGKNPRLGSDGKKLVSIGPAGQVVLRSTTQPDRKEIASGTYTEAVLSPNGRLAAMTNGRAISLVSAVGTFSTTRPVIVVRDGYGQITNLSWR